MNSDDTLAATPATRSQFICVDLRSFAALLVFYPASAFLLLCLFAAQAAAPAGWYVAGSAPRDYECSVDPANPYRGQPSTYLKSREGAKATGFGTMMQDFSANQYVGKRIRLSANLKSEGVQEWGGLWMRVDDANHPTKGHPSTVAFDNMRVGPQDRSIKGTTAWQSYSIVLDVPEGATSIFIGFLLTGPGALWVNGMKLEAVGLDVPVTGQSMTQPHDGPANLTFDK